MQADDETKELLGEIRDALRAHTKRYDEYLRDHEELANRQMEQYEQAKQNAYSQWAYVGVVIFAAVALARLVVP